MSPPDNWSSRRRELSHSTALRDESNRLRAMSRELLEQLADLRCEMRLRMERIDGLIRDSRDI
jgi:hypothetical protein